MPFANLVKNIGFDKDATHTVDDPFKVIYNGNQNIRLNFWNFQGYFNFNFVLYWYSILI